MTVGVKVYQNDGFVAIACSGGETSLAFDFPIFSSSYITIIRTRAAVDTTLALTTDYTIGAGSISQEAGGTATLLVAATAGDVYTLLLDVPESRVTDFSVAGDFLADTLNLELDLITQQNQQLRRDIDKSIAFAETSTSTAIMPEPSASKIIGWNSAGTDLTNYTVNSAAYLSVSSFIETLLDDTTASAALTTLGVSTFAKTILDDTTAGAALTTLGVSAFAQTILDDTTAAAAKVTLGVLPQTLASASGAASIELAEDTDNGAHKITLAAPASLAADRAVTFPDVAGTVALITANTLAASGSMTLSNGLIIKWGNWTSHGTTGNTVAVAFSGSFATLYGIVFGASGTTATTASAWYENPTVSGFDGRATTISATQYYMAIGI